MPRNCCNFAILLLATLLVTAYTTQFQNPIVVDDYSYNEYQNSRSSEYQNSRPNEYQNFRPNEHDNGRPREYQNFQSIEYQNLRPNEYENVRPKEYQSFRPNEYDNVRPKEFQNFRPNEYENVRPKEYQNFRPLAKFDRPIVVKAVEKKKDQQDFSKIPGIPGVDYPLYHTVPPTSFSCAHVPYVPGMYANVETGCQAYHICHDGREGHQGASFLCTNGTVFNQREFACDWWYNVNCADAPSLYRINSDVLKNPYISKEEKEAYRKRTRIVVY